MRSVTVTITAQVWINENDLEQLMENDGLEERAAVEAYAMEQVGKAIPTDEYIKERGIVVNLSTLHKHISPATL